MPDSVQYGSAPRPLGDLATVLCTSMMLLDAAAVGIALPTMGREFDADMDELGTWRRSNASAVESRVGAAARPGGRPPRCL